METKIVNTAAGTVISSHASTPPAEPHPLSDCPGSAEQTAA